MTDQKISIPGHPTTAEEHLERVLAALKKYAADPGIPEQAEVEDAVQAATEFLEQRSG